MVHYYSPQSHLEERSIYRSCHTILVLVPVRRILVSFSKYYYTRGSYATMTTINATMPSKMNGRKNHIRVTTKRLSSGVLDEDNAIFIDGRRLECMGTVGRMRKGSSFSSSTEATDSSIGEDEEALRSPYANNVENSDTLHSVLKVRNAYGQLI